MKKKLKMTPRFGRRSKAGITQLLRPYLRLTILSCLIMAFDFKKMKTRLRSVSNYYSSLFGKGEATLAQPPPYVITC
jgi:hypothetical protein